MKHSTELRDIQLEFSNKDIWKLHRRSNQREESRYVRAKAAIDGENWCQVRVRPRGNHKHHRELLWKSYRIRVPLSHWRNAEGDSFLQPQRLDLSLPKQAMHPFVFASKLNTFFELPKLNAYSILVYENGQFRNSREAFEQYSALTMARNQWPLSIVYAEDNNLSMYDLFSEHRVNDLKNVWKVMGPLDGAGYEKLGKLYEAIALNHPIQDVIDIDQFFRWNCHWLLLGCNHQGGNNVRLYYHPGVDRFWQLPWDLTSFSDSDLSDVRLPLDLVPYSHHILFRLLSDVRYRHQRNQRLSEYLSQRSLFEKVAEDHLLDVNRYYMTQMYEVPFFNQPLNPKRVDPFLAEQSLQWFKARLDYLKGEFDQRLVYAQSAKSLKVRSFGVQPFKFHGLKTQNPLDRLEVSVASSDGAVHKVQLFNKDGVLAPVEPIICFPFQETVPAYFPPKSMSWKDQLRFEGGAFELSWDEPLGSFEPLVSNPYSVGRFEVLRKSDVELNAVSSWLPLSKVKAEERLRREIVWSGRVHIKNDFVLHAQDALVIQAGTKIIIEEDRGVYLYGKVTFLSSAQAPISVSKGSHGSFNTFALNGAKISKGRISHLEVTGGKGGIFRNCLYEGALSIYNCGEVELENISVLDNPSEDGLNVKFMRVKIKDSIFRRNNDGLDLDGCLAVLDNCSFTDCTNDGLDLGDTELTASNLEMGNNQDKGLSVGGQSLARLSHSSYYKNKVGVAVKDASKVQLNDSEIYQNKVGLVIFNKASRFEEFKPFLGLNRVEVREHGVDLIKSASSQVKCVQTQLNVSHHDELPFDIKQLYE